MTKRYLVLLLWLAVGLSSPLLAQKVGPEFQVNTFTTNGQQDPSVASDADGNFVVVWESYGQDGSDTGVFGQRYDRLGNRLGSEFQANIAEFDDQNNPSVASDASGAFVVVWQWGGAFARRYDSDGNPLSGEILVTSAGGFRPSIAMDATGAFVVVWYSDFPGDGSSHGVFARRFDSGGNPLGDQFQVNTFTTGSQSDPAVASDASGNFVIVWESEQEELPDGEFSNGIFGQRYDSGGKPLGNEFQVNTYTTNAQTQPVIASDANGNFVVVWVSRSQDGGGGYTTGLFGQRHDGGGERIGSEFRVNTSTRGSQNMPSVTSDASGNFVVVWRSKNAHQDGSLSGVFGQRYDSGGNSIGGEFQVNTYTRGYQSAPSVASDPKGNFVVVWESYDQDGDGNGIFGQRSCKSTTCSAE